MMKKCILIFAFCLGVLASGAHDFSVVVQSGQTLYFNITNSGAVVTYAGSESEPYAGVPKPSGSLIIPSTVEWSNNTYSVVGIGTYAFSSCTGLSSVVIPNSVTHIDIHAFSNCDTLSSVVIPNSVVTIANYAFSKCYNLENVTIPNSVTTIGNYAFRGCSNFTEVELPNSVTAIGNYVYAECRNLSNVYIPNSLVSIGDYAFNNCMHLDSIFSDRSLAPTLGGTHVFDGVNNSIPIFIPCGSTMLYMARWGDCMSNFIEPVPLSITVSADNAAHGEASTLVRPTCSNANAFIVATAYEGYIFSHWSDGVQDNPRWVSLMVDTVLTANFVEYNPTEMVVVNDTAYITIRHTVDYYISVHDTVYDTIVTELSYRTLTVNTENADKGIAAGSGRFPEGAWVEIAAIPNSGYRFVKWRDGNVDNPRTVDMSGDLSFVAVFEESNVGIGEVATESFRVSTMSGQIVVSEAEGELVRVFDAVGRCLRTMRSVTNVLVCRMPSAGVYMVQVGNHPAVKVVVL